MQKPQKFNKGSFSLFRKLNKKQVVADILIIFVLLFALHLNFSEKIIADIRSWIISTDVWIYNTAGKVREVTSNFKYFLSENIDQVIYDLRNENARLVGENQKLENLKIENEELRKLLGLPKNENYISVVGKVVTIFSNDYMRSCVINVGSEKGIRNNDMVRNYDGLIGRIIETDENWSRVLLIIDPNSNIPAKIGDEKVNAIISGNNSKKLYISMIHEDTSVHDNDFVETSSYGENFCEKIPIGTLIKKDNETFIVPFVDFNNLNYVEIIGKRKNDQ